MKSPSIVHFGIGHLPASLAAVVALNSLLPAARAQPPARAEREVVAGITTTRAVPGAPYQLRGKRIVFTTWYYIQPGDLDWRDAEGRHIDLDADVGVAAAKHAGINAPRGIRIVAEKPQVVAPLSRPGRMTIRDGDAYKAWTSKDYYESTDGMKWERKAGLVLDAPITDGIHHVFVDPVARPLERYKAVWPATITRAEFESLRSRRRDCWEPRALVLLGERDVISCLRGSVSPDGVRWTTLPDPLVVEYSDTLNTAYYDTLLGEYVIYTRQWSIGPRAGGIPADIRNSWTGSGRRAIGRTASRDFSRFSPSETVLEPTPELLPSEQLYTNCHTTIPGAPEQHLMFPTIWNASIDDTTRIGLAASADGKLWHWVPGGELLRTSPFGRPDGGCVWVTPDLIELPDGNWALPYLAHNVPHKYPRGQRQGIEGYLVWPQGRLVALEAVDEGEFTTMSLIPPGKTLKVNAVTARTGWVKIEVLGVAGRGLADCTPIVGDRPWTRVAWTGGGDLGDRQSVTLRVQMKHAKLYGLEFE